MRILLNITQDETAALLRIKDAGRGLLAPLARAWGSAAQEVLGQAVKKRFTGKGPFPVAENRLGVVTNRLRKSMRATAVQVDAAGGGVSVSMGSNVSYYAAHEFGFRGRVQVKGHTRKAVADAKLNSRGKITKANVAAKKARIGRGRANFSTVRPHSRRVNIPARRPLGTELESIGTRLAFYKKMGAAIRNFILRKS